MLALAGVTREFRIGTHSVRALDDVSLRVGSGEFVAVVGPSGSGKSTLLNLLGALDRPDSGSVRFQDREINTLGDAEQSEFRLRNIGFVFQAFNLFPTMSAWENVALPQLLAGESLRDSRERAFGLLARVGLSDRVRHRPAELSGGQMQRVAVARALMPDPALVLADEPTGNLDSASGDAIMALLGEVAHRDHRAVVVVTHNASDAAATDRVITLHDGRIRADSSAAN